MLMAVIAGRPTHKIGTITGAMQRHRNSTERGGKVHVPIYKFVGGEDPMRDVVLSRGELFKGGKASFFIRHYHNDPSDGETESTAATKNLRPLLWPYCNIIH